MAFLDWLRDAEQRCGDRPALEADSSALDCPVARCQRCSFQFPTGTLAAVCPRCLERFSPAPCDGGCWTCPLVTRAFSRVGTDETDA